MTPRRTRARKYISLREKLAAALSMLLPAEQRDDLRERKVSAKSVIALFDQDHNILHAFGGEDRWWNLTPLLRAAHREKARRDTSIVAKSVRIVADEAEHQARMAEKAGEERRAAILRAAVESAGRARPRRPWPKQKISRGFQRR